jgi:predicted nucleic acid-binding protein
VIVVDTNVVSELMRPAPAPAVENWIRATPAADVYTTAITTAEIGYGIERLPDGRRKEELAATAVEIFSRFADHILAFDAAAAGLYGVIVSRRERAGAPITGFEAQIAAICQSKGATLATRNVRDFDGTGIKVMSPWVGPGRGAGRNPRRSRRGTQVQRVARGGQRPFGRRDVQCVDHATDEAAVLRKSRGGHEHDPGVETAFRRPPGVENDEVPDVGRDEDPVFGGSRRQDRLIVMDGHQVGSPGHRLHIVPPGLEAGADLGREHLVKEQPGRLHPASSPRDRSAAAR